VLSKQKPIRRRPMASAGLWRDKRKSAVRHKFWRMSIYFKEAFNPPQADY